jgi:hypothetical protein
VRIIEELLEWKSSGSGKENRINDRGIRCADHATPSIRKMLALTSPKSSGRSVDIVRLRTKGHGVFSLVLETTKAVDVLEMVNSFLFAKQNCDWKGKLPTLCTDGAPAMLCNTFGFAALVKKQAPHVVLTHCFYTDMHWQQRPFQRC